MPLSHRVLAAWYTQLAQQLEAGLTLHDALLAPAPSRGVQKISGAMAARIEAGGAVDDALRIGERSLPAADLLTLSAAAEAGRMPVVLHSLSTRHARLGAAKARVVLACLYPLAIVHVGLVLIPIVHMIDWEKGFHWDAARYVRELAALVLPLWGVILFLYILARRQSAALRRVASLLPATSGYLRAQALSDLCFALGNFLAAGVPIGDAWATVGLITPSPRLRPAAEAMSGLVQRGQAPGPHLAAWSCFPPDFVAQYRTGENTGQLDTTLLRLSEQYQDTANRSLTVATMLYPALMFVVVAGAVVYAVLSFYAGYLKMVMKMAE